MELIYGAGRLDRRVPEVEALLREWRVKEADWGQLYLEFEPCTPKDRVLVEDLAATMLLNSRVAAQAAKSVYRYASALDLGVLPDKALEGTTVDERQTVAEIIGTMTSWPWVGASVATKTLHKKRPALIPVLDNLAIFGAYMNPLWPEQRASADTIKSVPRIREALDWIATDITRPENEPVWLQLRKLEPERSRIELFDMVWWMYFRGIEPVQPARPPGTSAQELPVEAVPPGGSQIRAEENVLLFRDDDIGYRSWLYAHASGFVVNTGRTPGPGYLVLHRATCETITPTPDRVWTRDYAKACSTDRYELEAWARSLGGRLTECDFCEP